MIRIQDILVDEKVFTTKFSCDYAVCQGACCWKGLEGVDTVGGALLDEEGEELIDKQKALLDFVPECYKDTVKKSPVESICNRYVTPLKEGSCVYCDKTAKTCALKPAFAAGVLSFDIPVHCHLYPLASELNEDGEHVLSVSDLWDDFCKEGYAKGERENTPIIHFCKEALLRMYGEEFYDALEQKRLEYDSNMGVIHSGE